MGLGKTLQTISLFAYLEEHHGIKGPHLVICPLSVLSSWMGELARWLPTSTVIRLHGPMQERERIKQVMRIQQCVFPRNPVTLLDTGLASTSS
jgi:SWI/SNF-related matrix-associated actin-dependent regulator of chromatin subfamily A member 5